MNELEEAYQQSKLDREREIRFNRDIQLHEIELMGQIQKYRKIMVSRYSARQMDMPLT